MVSKLNTSAQQRFFIRHNIERPTLSDKTAKGCSDFVPVQFSQSDHFVKSTLQFGGNGFIGNLAPEKMSALLSAKLNELLNKMELGDILTLGRSPENSLQILIPSVSRNHACIVKKSDGYYIQDKGTAIEGISLCPGSINGTQHVTFENALPNVQDIRGPLKPLAELTPREMALSKTELRHSGPSVKLSKGDVIVMSQIRLHLDDLPLTDKQKIELANKRGLFDDIPEEGPEEGPPGFASKAFCREWMEKRTKASKAYDNLEKHLKKLTQIYEYPHLIPRVPPTWIQQVKLLQNPDIQFQMYSCLSEMGFGSQLAKTYVLRLNFLAQEVSKAIHKQRHVHDSKNRDFLNHADALKHSVSEDRLGN